MPHVPEPFPAESVSEHPSISDWPAPPPPQRPDRPWILWAGRGFVGLLTVLVILFTILYVKVARRIDGRLTAGPFAGTLNIFSAPKTLSVGDELSEAGLVDSLQRRGYTPGSDYRERKDAVDVAGAWRVEFSGDHIAGIISLPDHSQRDSFTLEPRLITNLSPNREKRRLVRFADIPAVLVHAVISAEDKHFFHHSGFDTLRIMKAAYVDLRNGRKSQGASTLTMQLARCFWLEPDKSWRRKAEEMLIASELERRLTKEQIFEDYANQVYLGRSGSFSINGFGEAARSFFSKDLSRLDASEAALLAGLVQRPSYYNPVRYPGRARERRNLVLALMRDNGYLTAPEYHTFAAAPLQIAPERAESQEGQYFLDLLNEELPDKLDDREQRARNVYSTLDPDLQHAANEAVHMGMQLVDQELRRRKKPIPAGQPQVALIALDPHTGAIRALVGGRDYRTSQLNRVLAMRQPGSVFKPFVYAAALATAIDGGKRIYTPASVVEDEQQTFLFGRTAYSPGNFHGNYMGSVSLRTALAHSLNSATVSLAQAVGYDRVAAIARRAGLDSVQPTPSIALGSYEATPLDIAGAYTAFANQGIRVEPTTIEDVRDRHGNELYQSQVDSQPALDPRVAYLMVNLMQEVLRSGTGAGVRSRGFTLPAAGKTGTSRDGWFAGFTNNLLCVVWVGFDDNRDLNLEGAHSALPIWAEFMKRAAKFKQYRDARPFSAPPGVVTVKLCPECGGLAGEDCPEPRSEVFIAGTQPREECEAPPPTPTQILETPEGVEIPATATTVPASPIRQ
jgi:penicillin-binding protein 1B